MKLGIISETGIQNTKLEGDLSGRKIPREPGRIMLEMEMTHQKVLKVELFEDFLTRETEGAGGTADDFLRNIYCDCGRISNVQEIHRL
ncbi:unnamed protein product [Allacma fusca]|uniref:Uncharacterized protein n=1 Tax=Allacma fusca TaxID=39272 RepID=A0A8J2JB35_9HEXA|nr:unnamed protein product [Allacma fusca]